MFERKFTENFILSVECKKKKLVLKSLKVEKPYNEINQSSIYNFVSDHLKDYWCYWLGVALQKVNLAVILITISSW